MKRKAFLLLCAGVWMCSCTREQPKTERPLPERAFPIAYRSHIYISGTIDSITGNYVFDTGASNLYIDTTHYVDNGFKHLNKFQAKMPGVGEKTPTVLVIRDSVPFSFGNHLYKTNIVPVFQLKPILGDFADGILGMEYFYNSVLEINYEHEYMRRHKSIDSVNTQDYTQLALTKRDNRLYLPLKITINDSTLIEGEFLVDLGAGGSVSLTRPTAEKHNLHNNINKKVRYYSQYGGVGGNVTEYHFIAQSIRIGDYVFENVRANYSKDKTGVMASDKACGLLGNDILDRFHLYIDFLNNHLYLNPNSNYNNPFDISRLGFGFVDRSETLKAWIVTGFFSGSDAEKAGLQIDDRIVTVDNLPIATFDYHKRKDYFDKADSLTLGVEENGGLKQITVKLAPVLAKNR